MKIAICLGIDLADSYRFPSGGPWPVFGLSILVEKFKGRRRSLVDPESGACAGASARSTHPPANHLLIAAAGAGLCYLYGKPTRPGGLSLWFTQISPAAAQAIHRSR